MAFHTKMTEIVHSNRVDSDSPWGYSAYRKTFFEEVMKTAEKVHVSPSDANRHQLLIRVY